MSEYDKLQGIPMEDYDEFGYLTTKEMWIDCNFKRYAKHGDNCTPLGAVNKTYLDNDRLMDENGMDKFVLMLAGMLYMMEEGEVDADQAYGTNHDINDFETGEYDDLFTEEDLVLIRKDIKKIKDYLAKHPELLED